MESDDDDFTVDAELEREIDAINNLSEIEQSTRDTYRERLKHFVAYLRETDPGLVTSDYSFHVAQLHIKQFQYFLVRRQKHDGVAYSTLEGYRTALIYAFREAKLQMPASWPRKLKIFYKGLRKRGAKDKQAGRAPLSVGQEPMPHRLYLWLCDYFIRDGNIFCWAYLTLSWNSMQRSGSVADIHLQHFCRPAEEDSLGLRVPTSKADQQGARAHIPWHLYANPNDFRQCCITALAAFLIMDGMHTDDKLFSGTSQERRYSDALARALDTDAGKAIMGELGLTHIAPHSTRKGSTDYASSGSTYAANFVSVTLRAGWSLGDVLGRYFGYQPAMDAFLGRLLAGLDVHSLAFEVLPPLFVSPVEDALIWRCFPGFKARSASSFIGILRFILPSLVHHHMALVQMLPRTHKLHYSVVFMDSSLRELLRTTLRSETLKPSGIPVHIENMRHSAAQLKQGKEILSLLRGEPEPPPSPGVAALVPTPAPPSAVSPVLGPTAAPRTVSGFPLDFDLPFVGPVTAWRLLMQGDPERDLPPFRHLCVEEFPGRTALRKRISEWLYFYKALRAQVDGGADDGEGGGAEDALDVEQQFYRAWAKFEFPKGKISTRPDQWSLATTVKKLRQIQAPLKAAPTAEVMELQHAIRPRKQAQLQHQDPLPLAEQRQERVRVGDEEQRQRAQKRQAMNYSNFF